MLQHDRRWPAFQAVHGLLPMQPLPLHHVESLHGTLSWKTCTRLFVGPVHHMLQLDAVLCMPSCMALQGQVTAYALFPMHQCCLVTLLDTLLPMQLDLQINKVLIQENR